MAPQPKRRKIVRRTLESVSGSFEYSYAVHPRDRKSDSLNVNFRLANSCNIDKPIDFILSFIPSNKMEKMNLYLKSNFDEFVHLSGSLKDGNGGITIVDETFQQAEIQSKPFGLRISDGKVNFVLDYKVAFYKTTEGERQSEASTESEHFLKLSSDLSNLLPTEEFSDVKLVCHDGQISVHKAILSARSKYFKRLFQTQAPEAEFVPIEGLDVKATSQFVDFLYSGRLNLTNQQNMLQAAKMFQHEELEAICQERLEIGAGAGPSGLHVRNTMDRRSNGIGADGTSGISSGSNPDSSLIKQEQPDDEPLGGGVHRQIVIEKGKQ